MRYHYQKWHKPALFVILAAIAVTLFISPGFYKGLMAEADYTYIALILAYLPGFFLLMGLFEVWLPGDFVLRHLGKQSGKRGSLYSFLLGSLSPGPLYLSFPIAAMLLKKGISRFNVAVFIGTWSSLKIVEEVFELQFLGARFLLIRILVTLPFVFLIAYIIEKIQFDKNE